MYIILTELSARSFLLGYDRL